jgi:hypothetical protein
MHLSTHPPSPFISHHWPHLLPDWDCAVASVLVILQPCGCDLFERTPIAEAQKYYLRQNFLQLGRSIVRQLQALGHTAALFDPRTGHPVETSPGPLTLDDVAVVRACLGFGTVESHGCKLLIHPHWGSSVYPATVLSSATPEVVAQVCDALQSEL